MKFVGGNDILEIRSFEKGFCYERLPTIVNCFFFYVPEMWKSLILESNEKRRV
jgi:hypothetical protein